MCFIIYPLLLFIHLVEVWEGAVDGYIRAGPEEGSCFQLVTCGSEPDLRRGGKERKGEERSGEKKKSPVKRKGVAGIKEEESQKEMRRGEEKKGRSEKGTEKMK